MLSTSNSPTPSSFLPLEMLGGLTFCCWIIQSSYFKNHRKEYLSVWSVQWEMRFWASFDSAPWKDWAQMKKNTHPWDIWRLQFRDLNLETMRWSLDDFEILWQLFVNIYVTSLRS
jgi:hypothetical protein